MDKMVYSQMYIIIIRRLVYENQVQQYCMHVKPNIVLHLSDVITSIKQNAPMELYFAQSVVEYLKKINGFERLF